jgi:integrase/recombinase XerD
MSTDLVVPDATVLVARLAAAGFLTGYTGSTRVSYTTDLRLFADWCGSRRLGVRHQASPRGALCPLAGGARPGPGDDRPAPVDAGQLLPVLRTRGPHRTVPAVHVRRPKLDDESHTLGLDRNELGGFLVAAGLSSARDHALASLLGLNGLRISEALGADIDDLDVERGHRTLKIVRKGAKHIVIPLAPRTARAIDVCVGERAHGLVFLGAHGQRLDRHAAARIVRRLARAAGITKRISPHSLRHSFITAALDAGVPLRDVQEAASH